MFPLLPVSSVWLCGILEEDLGCFNSRFTHKHPQATAHECTNLRVCPTIASLQTQQKAEIED